MSVNEIPDTPQAGGLQVGLRALILALLASWLLWEFGRVMVSITAAWGLAAALTDSIALHRFGELLIVLPLATFALLGPTWMAARRVEYARRVRWVVWAGAVLNAAAWLSLRQRVDWSWWSLALAFLGLLIPLALGWSARRDRQFPSMLLLVLWILLHLASSFTAFLSTGYALGPFPIAPPRPTADRDERWRQDIRYLASEMERLHKNLYHTTSPEVFGAEAARLVAEVPNLQDHEIAVGLMRLVASVGDAHTEFPL